MSLVDTYRPACLDEIIGQQHVTRVLKKIIANPQKYPKNMIFGGAFGVGKTSAARAFYNELRVHYPDATLHEFRNRDFRKAEAMDSIKQLFEQVFRYKSNYSVVVLNEFQLASQTAQSILLETLEDNTDVRAFFIFTTTNVSKLIDTIVSRCLEFNFKLIEDELVVAYLRRMADLNQIVVADETLAYICKLSGGHMRDALKYLDLYSIDAEMFFANTKAVHDDLRGYIFGHEKLRKVLMYDVGRLSVALNTLVSDIMLETLDTKYISAVKFFEHYLSLKNNVTTIEDLSGLLFSMKRLNTQLRLL